MECCPGHATPALAVMSSKCQLPRLRYSTFVPSTEQKYRSHKPSPSTSPAATPLVINEWLERKLTTGLEKVMPVWAGGIKVKPGGAWLVICRGKVSTVADSAALQWAPSATTSTAMKLFK